VELLSSGELSTYLFVIYLFPVFYLSIGAGILSMCYRLWLDGFIYFICGLFIYFTSLVCVCLSRIYYRSFVCRLVLVFYLCGYRFVAMRLDLLDMSFYLFVR
jgi:hypothetical protein